MLAAWLSTASAEQLNNRWADFYFNMVRQMAVAVRGQSSVPYNVSDQYEVHNVVGKGAYGVVSYVKCDILQ